MTGPDPLAAQMIAPQPVPTQFAVDVVPLEDGSAVVVLQVLDPTGTHVSFLDPATARRLASLLVDHAQRAQARRLIVPQMQVDPSVLGDLNGDGKGPGL
jgi:hypothetical protein